MEAETALVRTECRVELHAIPPIDLDLILVIFPDNAELDDTLGDCGDSKCLFVLRIFMEERRVFEGRDQLCG